MQEAKIQAQVIELTLTEADIADLVQGITKEQVVDLVKRENYLSQQLFRGFRPDHLPWATVPDKFAQDAVGNVQKVSALVKRWLECNQELINKLASIPANRLRDELISLFIEQGVEKRPQILWALRLDERLEIHEALTQGLAQELADETSQLMLLIQTARNAINKAVEPVQHKLVQTVIERDEARAGVVKLKRIYEATKAQAEKWQTDCATAVAKQGQLHEQLAELQVQKQVDQEAMAQLQQQLEYEQAEARELRQSISSLRATLHQQAEAAEGRDDILLELEAERKSSSTLRLENKKLEQKLVEAYEKRDDALSHMEELEAQRAQAHHDKEVIINQKRDVQARLDKIVEELETTRTQRGQETIQQLSEIVLPEEVECAWLTARQEVNQQLHAMLAVLTMSETEPEADKLSQWQAWLDKEISLVTETLQALATYAETKQLPGRKSVESAQSLLTVRWYLLEHIRRAILHLEEQTLFSI
jgi:chromosome segregation ATPase